jgi:FkbM family methyltransferase
MEYYSQFNQDEFVYENYFKERTDGIFVDIGAYDGVIGSNSLFFENLGWQGVCIEPNPEMFKKLQELRKCKCVPYAISDKSETARFFQINEGGPATLSGLVDEYSQQAIARINKEVNQEDQNFDYIDVECKTFESIVKYKHIDYLSLDTEGNELKILQSIDYSEYFIDVITVENNDYDQKFIDFLTQKGYQFVTRLGCDEVFKRK